MSHDPKCRLCTREGYDRVCETAYFTVLVGEGREDPYFIVPKAHIELMDIHELFGAEMWGLIRHVSKNVSKVVFLSGANAGTHGYLCVSLMRAADERWKVKAA